MTCTRCHGLLVNIPSLVWLSSEDYQPTQSDRCEGEAWQCLNCGNYIDAVILANRCSLPESPLEEETAGSAAVGLVGGFMTGLPAGKAQAVRYLTQPTTLTGHEGIGSLVTELANEVADFFPSEFERSV